MSTSRTMTKAAGSAGFGSRWATIATSPSTTGPCRPSSSTTAPRPPVLAGSRRTLRSSRTELVLRAMEPGKDPEEPEGDLGILPNTGRYFLYFISVLTGTAYVAFRPVFRFMKDSPLKVLLVFGIAVLSYESVSFVVQAMLGMNGDPFGGPVRGGNGGF
ncbi:hypothetical protein HKI87_14g76360 [Chloropicon roscoffensis]|uniref:Uncharacterized protein ycf33 n=1 Tax=Chloropicon roscoffensis TaxID=1461544 RepID=A0AAX4PJM8_9CHLO